MSCVSLCVGVAPQPHSWCRTVVGGRVGIPGMRSKGKGDTDGGDRREGWKERQERVGEGAEAQDSGRGNPGKGVGLGGRWEGMDQE